MYQPINPKERAQAYQAYTVKLKGSTFIRYAGLLTLAHERGKLSISTELQTLDRDKGFVLFKATATVTLKDGSTVSFTGWGDATPKNVNKMIIPHLIRMAETRAKARALRDLVGCPYTAIEELSND